MTFLIRTIFKKRVLTPVSFAYHALTPNQGCFNRALVCSLHHALGRAGELALNAWPSVEYNFSLLAPQLMWKEFKTGKSCPISFFPDFCSYLIDWCHCMFCYLVSDGSDSYSTLSSEVPNGNTFIFPSLRHKDQNAIARDVTALLHRVAKTKKVVGLTQKHSSQGFKHGAADDCSLNPNCPVPSSAARAGWDYSGEVCKKSFSTSIDYFADAHISFLSGCAILLCF